MFPGKPGHYPCFLLCRNKRKNVLQKILLQQETKCYAIDKTETVADCKRRIGGVVRC